MTTTPRRAPLHAKVSTGDQTCENQLLDLRRLLCLARMDCHRVRPHRRVWREDQPATIGPLMVDAVERRGNVVVCWRLDRFGRNLRHLITTIENLNAAVGARGGEETWRACPPAY